MPSNETRKACCATWPLSAFYPCEEWGLEGGGGGGLNRSQAIYIIKKKKKRVGEGVVGQLPVYQYDSGGVVESARLKVHVISLAYSI